SDSGATFQTAFTPLPDGFNATCIGCPMSRSTQQFVGMTNGMLFSSPVDLMAFDAIRVPRASGFAARERGETNVCTHEWARGLVASSIYPSGCAWTDLRVDHRIHVRGDRSYSSCQRARHPCERGEAAHGHGAARGGYLSSSGTRCRDRECCYLYPLHGVPS